MRGDAREVELKFSLDPDRGSEVLAWLAQGRPQSSQILEATYFDTAKNDLRCGGLALRVRREGDDWIQTVKSRSAAGGRIGRGEWSCRVAGPSIEPSRVARSPAGAILRPGAPLEPRFVVRVERRSVDIRAPDSVIEASLDQGAAQAGEASTAIHELELELKSGRPEALFDLAARLRSAFPVRLSIVTKADRGWALVDGGALRARHFRPPALTRAMTAGEAFQAIARAALEQTAWNLELLRASPDTEAIHQARVGLRRLRASLATFKSVARDSRRSSIRADLKALSAELDTARNLDVFIEGPWRRVVANTPGDAGPARAAQAAAHERARAAAGSEAASRTLLETLAWIEVGPWTLADAKAARRRDRSIATFATASLDAGRDEVLEAGRGLRRLDPHERHKVRIKAKGLRYAADVFQQLFDDHPRRIKRFMSPLIDLLETLGDLNDISTAKVLAAGFPLAEQVTIEEAERERGLLSAAHHAFEALKAARPYWKT